MFKKACFSVNDSLHRLSTLRKEIAINKASINPVDIQALPYLTASIKEALRLSLANPTRLPRTVPSSSWTFKSIHFPSGTDVGCSTFELHLDPVVFPKPYDFMPERWLEGDVHSKEKMNKNWFAFGAGTRGCLARNLAMTELYMGTEKLVESGVLEGAMPCQDKVEILEWFNSSVKGEKIELVWPKS
jgi:cytochrome P450